MTIRSCVPTTFRRPPLVYVIRYSVVDASHDTSRDGSVTVHLNGDVTNGTDLQILWTNGVVGTSRLLTGVRPGVYGAIVLAMNGAPVRCMHMPAAARVRVRVRESAMV